MVRCMRCTHCTMTSSHNNKIPMAINNFLMLWVISAIKHVLKNEPEFNPKIQKHISQTFCTEREKFLFLVIKLKQQEVKTPAPFSPIFLPKQPTKIAPIKGKNKTKRYTKKKLNKKYFFFLFRSSPGLKNSYIFRELLILDPFVLKNKTLMFKNCRQKPSCVTTLLTQIMYSFNG